jgi:hypothetical protein
MLAVDLSFWNWRIWNPTTWGWTRLGEAVAVVLVVSLFALALVVLRSVWKRNMEEKKPHGAVWVAAYDCVWLGLLFLFAIDYLRGKEGKPFHLAHTVGSMPTPVLWFGLLGGVMISLSGVAEKSADGSWNEHWTLWHLLHPLIGAACGLVAVLIFQAGIMSIGSTPNTGSKPAENAAYYVIAFLVAYREKTFRDLMKRLADTVFTTGPQAPAITAVTPPGGTAGLQVAITGSGLSVVNDVKFGSATATVIAQTDNYLLVTAPTRATADALGIRVIVSGPNGAAASTYTYAT